MATRQFQIPGWGYINTEDDGREYQIPGAGIYNGEESAATGRIMSSLARHGGLAGLGGIAGAGGGLAA